MYLTTTVHACDVLDHVHVSIHVRCIEDDGTNVASTVFACTTTVPGTGESDPRQWAVDALVALLEAM